jgi:hypothetical protein
VLTTAACLLWLAFLATYVLVVRGGARVGDLHSSDDTSGDFTLPPPDSVLLAGADGTTAVTLASLLQEASRPVVFVSLYCTVCATKALQIRRAADVLGLQPVYLVIDAHIDPSAPDPGNYRSEAYEVIEGQSDLRRRLRYVPTFAVGDHLTVQRIWSGVPSRLQVWRMKRRGE